MLANSPSPIWITPRPLHKEQVLATCCRTGRWKGHREPKPVEEFRQVVRISELAEIQAFFQVGCLLVDVGHRKFLRQAKGSINGLGKRAVGQNIVRVGDIGRTAFEVECQTDTLVLFTLAHFQCLPMILLYNRVLRPGKRSRRFAIPLEIEGFSKILVLGIGQLIGECATFVRAFFQHFPNERLRVDHVLQTHGSHCVVEDAIISQEFVDGLNIADVLAIVFGLTFDHRVRGDRLQRAFHIGF